jgi:hypothetical protein
LGLSGHVIGAIQKGDGAKDPLREVQGKGVPVSFAEMLHQGVVFFPRDGTH